MPIGIIGAGAIGQALAYRFVAAGEQVVISNSRGPQSLRDLAASIGPALTPATVAESAKEEIVVLAVPWRRLSEAVAAADVLDWQERIVIDTTNPLGPPDFKVADLDGRTSSEVVAELVPGARLVKAFNTLTPAVLGSDPHFCRTAGDLPLETTRGQQARHAAGGSGGVGGHQSGPAGVRRTAATVPGRPLPTLNLLLEP